MTYNGHKNWTHWNVALWINNDEGLYNEARFCCRVARTKQQAAEMFYEGLVDAGIKSTPDGARYSVSAIRAAMREM
jgi:hypothetical protein